jgi:hypothetical protein
MSFDPEASRGSGHRCEKPLPPLKDGMSGHELMMYVGSVWVCPGCEQHWKWTQMAPSKVVRYEPSGRTELVTEYGWVFYGEITGFPNDGV